MSSKEQITARVESDVVAVLDRIAEAERRPRSALVRNVLADYAAYQRRQLAGERVNA